ncbi:hypothetical protein [Bradyrhizobium sp. WSM1743]|uniref:hypothetical protein n=1 Tax=Bradyrhizobium sp. WSM1743 TaxID=318996 RepID=UPI00040BEC71|nr:hypothetical protein [Bradyrhizobium sp. WSM1743]
MAVGIIVLFAEMPTGANAYICAVQYQRLVNPVSGAELRNYGDSAQNRLTSASDSAPCRD